MSDVGVGASHGEGSASLGIKPRDGAAGPGHLLRRGGARRDFPLGHDVVVDGADFVELHRQLERIAVDVRHRPGHRPLADKLGWRDVGGADVDALVRALVVSRRFVVGGGDVDVVVSLRDERAGDDVLNFCIRRADVGDALRKHRSAVDVHAVAHVLDVGRGLIVRVHGVVRHADLVEVQGEVEDVAGEVFDCGVRRGPHRGSRVLGRRVHLGHRRLLVGVGEGVAGVLVVVHVVERDHVDVILGLLREPGDLARVLGQGLGRAKVKGVGRVVGVLPAPRHDGDCAVIDSRDGLVDGGRGIAVGDDDKVHVTRLVQFRRHRQFLRRCVNLRVARCERRSRDVARRERQLDNLRLHVPHVHAVDRRLVFRDEVDVVRRFVGQSGGRGGDVHDGVTGGYVLGPGRDVPGASRSSPGHHLRDGGQGPRGTVGVEFVVGVILGYHDVVDEARFVQSDGNRGVVFRYVGILREWNARVLKPRDGRPRGRVDVRGGDGDARGGGLQVAHGRVHLETRVADSVLFEILRGDVHLHRRSRREKLEIHHVPGVLDRNVLHAADERGGSRGVARGVGVGGRADEGTVGSGAASSNLRRGGRRLGRVNHHKVRGADLVERERDAERDAVVALARDSDGWSVTAEIRRGFRRVVHEGRRRLVGCFNRDGAHRRHVVQIVILTGDVHPVPRVRVDRRAGRAAAGGGAAGSLSGQRERRGISRVLARAHGELVGGILNHHAGVGVRGGDVHVAARHRAGERAAQHLRHRRRRRRGVRGSFHDEVVNLANLVQLRVQREGRAVDVGHRRRVRPFVHRGCAVERGELHARHGSLRRR